MDCFAEQNEDFKTHALLVADHIDRLRNHLRSRLSNHEDADDLTQEACLRMLQMKSPNAIRNPAGYLYRIARNLLHHYYSDRRVPIDDSVVMEDLACSGLPLDESACLHNRRRRIDTAMRELSQKCQTVIHLRWREGCTVNEIADHMQLSRGMVKKYLAASIVHFRKRLVPIDPPNSHYL